VGAGHFLKIKLHRVDCEKQSPRWFSDAAHAATVGNGGAVVSESSYRSIIRDVAALILQVLSEIRLW